MPDRPTILVVDDDADGRSVLCDLLNARGYDAVGCENGQQALDRIGVDETPCLVLLDLSMPVMGGERFVQALRTHTDASRVEVIVVTGDASARDRLGAHGLEVLVKPLDFDRVIDAVERHCC